MKRIFPDKSDTGMPVELKPPDTPVSTGSRTIIATPFILLIFILLIIATGYVLIILPGLFSPSSQESRNSASNNSPILPANPVGTKLTVETPYNKGQIPAETEEIHTSLFSIKTQAESENITEWAPEQYKAALEIEKRGDQFFKNNEFTKSGTAYRNAVNAIKTILESKNQLFETSLKQATAALEDGHGKDAQQLFRTALAIDPASNKASVGIQRAETIEQVTRLYNDALSLKQAGKLDEAKTTLMKLLAEDPYYLPGKQQLEHVSIAIKDHAFAEEMSLFFAALETGQFQMAEQSIIKLKNLRKEDPEVFQAEKMLSAERESSRIHSLQEKAASLIEKEQWREALAVYNQVITIAPEALFAVNGKIEATRRLELDINLTTAIGNPRWLQDVSHREQAQKLLNYANTIQPQPPHLASQTATLEKLIEFAATPVSVTIDSDNMTEITIYHLGRIGHFYSQQFILTPGTYTVTGSKAGFQDIRLTIEVDPKKTINRFHIQCKVPI